LQPDLQRQARKRQGDGFPLDQSRVAYLSYLRREHMRLMEKRRELMR
jgi:hypothetical protein